MTSKAYETAAGIIVAIRENVDGYYCGTVSYTDFAQRNAELWDAASAAGSGVVAAVRRALTPP